MRFYPDLDLAVALQINHGAADEVANWTDRLAGRLAKQRRHELDAGAK